MLNPKSNFFQTSFFGRGKTEARKQTKSKKHILVVAYTKIYFDSRLNVLTFRPLSKWLSFSLIWNRNFNFLLRLTKKIVKSKISILFWFTSSAIATPVLALCFLFSFNKSNEDVWTNSFVWDWFIFESIHSLGCDCWIRGRWRPGAPRPVYFLLK